MYCHIMHYLSLFTNSTANTDDIIDRGDPEQKIVKIYSHNQGRAVKFQQPKNKMRCAQCEKFFCSGVG